jgi:hypothetical protein
LDHVFTALVHAAVDDLYWEVKFNALMFWRVVICRQFQHQGMIDGSFPTVTFSTEHKKIVTLTKKEILLRLKKVLNELSLRGCLGVLLACLSDSDDLEVIKLNVVLVQKILSYLNKYEYVEESKKSLAFTDKSKNPKPFVDTNFSEYLHDIKSTSSSPQTINNAEFNGKIQVFHPPTVESLQDSCCSDGVIEAICNADDMGLLATAYQNNLKISTEGNANVEDDLLLKQYIPVSSEEFLSAIIDKNLDGVVEEKLNWLHQSESFSSLLDDVLLSLGDSIAIDNEIDCY